MQILVAEYSYVLYRHKIKSAFPCPLSGTEKSKLVNPKLNSSGPLIRWIIIHMTIELEGE